MKSLKTPDVSVIIPTYNRSELLDYSLNSLVLQEPGQTSFEVIVADDGSSDNTKEIVRSYAEKMDVKYVFQEDKGYRPASARNLGISIAQGDICVMIDSGVILDPSCLVEHVNFHRSKGTKVAAIGYVYGFDQGDDELLDKLKEIVIPMKPKESISNLSKDKAFKDARDYHYINYRDKIQELPAPWIYFWTCHLSVGRENLINVGMFDEQYNGRWGCEDNDLGFRLNQSGTGIHLLRSAKSIHYPHYEDFSEKKKQGYLNCLYFNDKFRTAETQLFLDTYMNDIFTDINIMRMLERV
jgi:glycosyltransferase involved in cell wall biosynthesis